ncbi:hypothetical protein [Variovorax sp. E3]|uniref:hypothetical protein n=1 Tax=Variovorax sp. E3 TaxID=1914993 RepID=UPI0018DC295C|nr:hypothetical protein [Variovorax sp. E3]
MKIFWSWQSDLPADVNNAFVREALVEAASLAAKDLGLDPANRPEIDHDTKGEPGLVEIAATIFKKVEEATLFVADVTPVGSTVGGKELANPNVMIELGYALSTLGHKALITVANTHFGGRPENLPFDLRHRRGAVSYELAPGASDKERKVQKKKLVKALAGAVAANLPAVLAAAGAEVTFRLKPIGAESTATWLAKSEAFSHRDATSPTVRNWSVPEGTKSYARLVPAAWKAGPPNRAQIENLATLGYTGAGWHGPNADGVAQVWAHPMEEDVAGVVSQYFQDSGEIWSFSLVVTGSVEDQVIISYARIIKDWEQFLQKAFAQCLSQGAQPPFYVEVGLAGLSGTVFPGQWRGQRVPALDEAVSHSEVVGFWDSATEREFLLAAVNKLRNGYALPPIDGSTLTTILESVAA